MLQLLSVVIAVKAAPQNICALLSQTDSEERVGAETADCTASPAAAASASHRSKRETAVGGGQTFEATLHKDRAVLP